MTIKYRRIIFSAILTVTIIPALLAQNNSYNYIRTQSMLDDQGSNYIDEIQYFDELGRPSLHASNGIATEGKYVFTLTTYNEAGYKKEEFLPIIGTTSSSNYYNASNMWVEDLLTYSDQYAYSYMQYDVLGRPVSVLGPGQAWHSANKSVRKNYDTNTDNSVKYYYVPADANSEIVHGGYFASGALHMKQNTDEDGHTLQIFTDRMNRKVLERRDGNNDTYYVYNTKGQLRFVLPPELAYYFENSLSSVLTIQSSNGPLLKYGYEYRYDGRGNCIYKRLPGCEPVYYIYDHADQCIFSQDGVQRTKGRWSFTIPDTFGRPALSGICHNTLTYTSEPLHNTIVTATYSTATNDYYGYSISGTTLTSDTLYSVCFYDNYSFIGNNYVPSALAYATPPSSEYGTQGIAAPKGLPSGNVTARISVTGVTGYDYTASYYDDRGRIVQTRSTNHMGGYEMEYLAYDFTGNVLKRNHRHEASNKPTRTQVFTNTYDLAGRLVTATHKLNNNTAVTIRSNTYDNLGRLTATTQGGTLTTNYTYNVRSWMKNITADTLFSETLYYNESYFGNKPRYGGNISTMEWNRDAKHHVYNFTYDGLSRLTRADYLENNIVSSAYSTHYTYGRMGNLLTLSRSGLCDNGVYGPIDNLSFEYFGNQLIKVDDAVSGPTYTGAFHFRDGSDESQEYFYDENGNLTKDLNKKVMDIQYNSLNLPAEIHLMEGYGNYYINHVYDATGRLLKTSYPIGMFGGSGLVGPLGTGGDEPLGGGLVGPITPPINPTMEDNPVNYCGNIIYENASIKQIMFDGGYITLSGTTPIYHYYLQDHLGNNRVVVKADRTVEQVNHYYPFGGLFGESTNGDTQRFKYNGKELERMHGLDWYDYGARHYDAAIGCWTTMDPLCEKYYNLSPYVYCGNNPIKFMDLHGDSLILSGSKEDIRATADVYEKGLGGYYNISVSKSGNVKMMPNMDMNPINMTKSQAIMFTTLSKIVLSDKKTTIKVTNNSESVIIGDITNNSIDIADIMALNGFKHISPTSALLHETIENYYVQNPNYKPNNMNRVASAHFKAMAIEHEYTGDGIIHNTIDTNSGILEFKEFDALTNGYGPVLEQIRFYNGNLIRK